MRCETVIVGVGSPLLADDYAGVVAVKLACMQSRCCIECPFGLEHCTHRIRGLNPKHLVVVDASISLPPGDVAVLPASLVADHTLHTHKLGLQAVARAIGVENIILVLLGVYDFTLCGSFSQFAREAIIKAMRVIRCLVGGLSEDKESVTSRDTSVENDC